MLLFSRVCHIFRPEFDRVHAVSHVALLDPFGQGYGEGYWLEGNGVVEMLKG